MTPVRVRRERHVWRDRDTGKTRWGHTNRNPVYPAYAHITSVRRSYPYYRWPTKEDHDDQFARFTSFFPEVVDAAERTGVVLRGVAGQTGFGNPVTLIRAWGSFKALTAFCQEHGAAVERYLPIFNLTESLIVYSIPMTQIECGRREGDWIERDDLIREFFPFTMKTGRFYSAHQLTRFVEEVREPVFWTTDEVRFRSEQAISYAAMMASE